MLTKRVAPITAILLASAGAWLYAQSDPQPAEFRPTALGMHIPLLSSREELDDYVGQLIAIRGTVTNSKIQTIIGVDVDAYDLRGEDAYAIGVLVKRTVNPPRGVQSRGPGVEYRLYSDLEYTLAPAREWLRPSEEPTRQ